MPNKLVNFKAPIRPLSINLESIVYNTFEQDTVKYTKYREAITKALKKVAERGNNKANAVVLGAGRGPLVSALLEAYYALVSNGLISFGLSVLAVEKNR